MTAVPPGPVNDGSSTPVSPALQVQVAGFGGSPIAVRVRQAGGVPAFFVHGFASSGAANWSATGWLSAFARAGVTTVAVDLRGHGLSATPHDPEAYSLPILLADLQCVLAALPGMLGPVPEIDVVGYSMGGRMVCELVAASTASSHARSQWVRGLPVIRRAVVGGYDGRPLIDGLEVAEFRSALGLPVTAPLADAGSNGDRDSAGLQSSGEQRSGQERSGQSSRQGSAGLEGTGEESYGRRMARIARYGGNNDLEALSALAHGLGDTRRFPSAAMGVPTLAAAGDLDTITDDTVSWAAGLPDGRHLVLPGRDHITAITAAAFRTAAVEFLTS